MDFVGSTYFCPVAFEPVDLVLISLVKHYPELYDPRHERYHDWKRQGAVWEMIAKHIDRKRGWCFSRWRKLKNLYKIRLRVSHGDLSAMRWPCDHALRFLATIEDEPELEPAGIPRRHRLPNVPNPVEHEYMELCHCSGRCQHLLR